MYVNYSGLYPVFYHFNFVSSSTGCADLAQRLGLKNTGLLISRTAQTIATLKIRCKDSVKTPFSVPRKVKILSKNRIFSFF